MKTYEDCIANEWPYLNGFERLSKLAKTSNTFETHTEPFFNDPLGLSSPLLEDSLQTLAENNERNMDEANEDMGYFKNAKCIGIWKHKSGLDSDLICLQATEILFVCFS